MKRQVLAAALGITCLVAPSIAAVAADPPPPVPLDPRSADSLAVVALRAQLLAADSLQVERIGYVNVSGFRVLSWLGSPDARRVLADPHERSAWIQQFAAALLPEGVRPSPGPCRPSPAGADSLPPVEFDVNWRTGSTLGSARVDIRGRIASIRRPGKLSDCVALAEHAPAMLALAREALPRDTSSRDARPSPAVIRAPVASRDTSSRVASAPVASRATSSPRDTSNHVANAPAVNQAPDSVVVMPPAPDTLPKFGEYVSTDDLPEAVTKVDPVYPDSARAARIEGQVVVQALVGKDGAVKDVRVDKSIPALDAAAVASVWQWRFKPAMAKGKPVAVWVAVPVKFALH